MTPISPELIDRTVAQALDHVFKIMVKTTIKLVDRAPVLDSALLGPGPQIMSCVGFIGELDGFVHLRFSEEFATVAAGLILSMTAAEVKAEGFDILKDSIGELTNMSVGSFKNCLCDLGYPCKLTLPTIVRGDKLSVPTAKGATRYVYHFEAVGHGLFADVQIKTG